MPKANYVYLPMERETIINFNEGDAELHVHTFNRKGKKRLLTYWKEDPNSVKFDDMESPTEEELRELVEDVNAYMDATLSSKKWFKWPSPPKRGYEMTEEQRAAVAERFRIAREARKNHN